MNMNDMPFNDRLKAIRIDHGLTKKAMAASVGVSAPTWTNYENDVTFPSPETCWNIQCIYHVNEEWLMSGAGERYEDGYKPGDPLGEKIDYFEMLTQDAEELRKKAADYIHELRKEIGPRKIILNCAGALIIRDDKILFQRRTDNGQWGLIGGLVEMNETYEEAALREIREETGLEVRLENFLGIFHNHNMVWSNGDAAHVISAMFTASIVSGEPRIDEESYELKFFDRESIPYLPAEDHIAALDAYFKGIRYPMLQENRYRG